jgi:hypothetical protein
MDETRPRPSNASRIAGCLLVIAVDPVLRAARNIVGALRSLVMALAIACAGGALVVCAIALAAEIVLVIGFGLAYIFAGEEGLAQARAFLGAGGSR